MPSTLIDPYMTAGLTLPDSQVMAEPAPAGGLSASYMGLVSMVSLKEMAAEERKQADIANALPMIQGLAGHVRQCWSIARIAKTQTIEPRLLRNLRARRGEYEPEILSEIEKQGGSDIYMMLTSNKCRAASSWLRDVILGARDEKPWTIDPTPIPDIPPQQQQELIQQAAQEAQQMAATTGQQMQPRQMEELVARLHDQMISAAKEKAKKATDRMELFMEDQLVEGGFQHALSEFIDDITTFSSAILKGPVVRNKPKLTWTASATGDYTLNTKDTLTLEWERVDPFMLYPAPHSTKVEDGYLIERHKLTRQQLSEMLGVEGYSEPAIRAVLDDYGRGGLQDWLYIDTAKAQAEGKSISASLQNTDGIIDALQFWGSVQGKLLVEWGMDEAEVPDKLRDYNCEVWVIGQWVIKATVNPDPLGRKPYYKASYEEIPGVFWGNSVADLCYDSQVQCNTAARAIANNMGIASGPQVTFDIDRLPTGEDLTQMYPWKIWQTISSSYGSTAQAVQFFQPPLVANELMQIYTFFSTLADEHTGVPRYMTGDGAAGGAGRTASGMSMMMSNAGKSMKQVIANLDKHIFEPLIERLYYYNMKYGEDNALKGDVAIRARGASYLVVKEQQQVRMNEFLQIVLGNPMLTEIVGEESVASLLREAAKQLDLDTDKIVPPAEVIRARMYAKQQAMAAQQGMLPTPGGPSPSPMPGNKQQLSNGAPITDNFSPKRGA